jgi:hypothetical protein
MCGMPWSDAPRLPLDPDGTAAGPGKRRGDCVEHELGMAVGEGKEDGGCVGFEAVQGQRRAASEALLHFIWLSWVAG